MDSLRDDTEGIIQRKQEEVHAQGKRELRSDLIDAETAASVNPRASALLAPRYLPCRSPGSLDAEGAALQAYARYSSIS